MDINTLLIVVVLGFFLYSIQNNVFLGMNKPNEPFMNTQTSSPTNNNSYERMTEQDKEIIPPLSPPIDKNEPRASHFRQTQPIQSKRTEIDVPKAHNQEDILPPADFTSDSTNISQYFKNNPDMFHRQFTGYVPNPDEWEKLGQDIFQKRMQETLHSVKPANAYLDPQTSCITIPDNVVSSSHPVHDST